MSAEHKSDRARRIRTRVVSGFAVLIPLVVTLWVLRFLLGLASGVFRPLVGQAFEEWHWLIRDSLSALLLLGVAYILGAIATHVVGRRVIGLGENVLLRVPFVKVIYRASKQVVEAFRTPRAAAFKSVVYVEFPRPGMRAVGFVTGSLEGPDGAPWNTIFIPTTPNPTTGFLQIVPAAALVPAGIPVEEAIKTIMSLGVLTPARMTGVT